MRFSIITVCYNSSATIKNTLDSVDMQTYNNFEHLVIDGKSTDGTLDILDRNLSPNRKVVSELDTGLYDAMNKGIEMSSGEYVLFLNADDVFNGNKSLETLARDIDLKSPEIIMNSIQYFGVGSNRKWIMPSKRLLKPQPHDIPPHPGFVIKREILGHHKIRFDLNYRICADMKFMLESLLVPNISILSSSHILTNMRHGGLSSGSLPQKWFEFYSIYKDLGYSSIQSVIFIITRYWNRLSKQMI